MLIKITQMFAAVLLVLLVVLLPACTAQEAGMQVLPALQQAGLQGKLIFIQDQQKGSQLVELDLATGKARTLFAAPAKSRLASAAVSPDGSSIVLAYAPPPPSGTAQQDNTDLYGLPADGSSAPQPLLQRGGQNESYANPVWAPDGQTIYYSHSAPTTTSRLGVESTIERFRPGGQPEVILRNATWPSLSPDGARLAYLGLSEFTSQNSLHLANADGANPAELVPAAQFPIVDAHIFSPDGQEIYFTAPDAHAQPVDPADTPADTPADNPSGARAWNFGVLVVTAHSDPADWYRVSVNGGQPQQVTQVKDVNMVAAFAPDGQWLAYASQKGLFVMKPDGSQLTQIASLVATGSIQWIK